MNKNLKILFSYFITKNFFFSQEIEMNNIIYNNDLKNKNIFNLLNLVKNKLHIIYINFDNQEEINNLFLDEFQKNFLEIENILNLINEKLFLIKNVDLKKNINIILCKYKEIKEEYSFFFKSKSLNKNNFLNKINSFYENIESFILFLEKK